ncbi:MAG: disulfide bond formation protein DsbD, partial [Pontibacter sp.]|nr:disulfide bond formation protein DsbD [Pontibacter sp.]
RQKIRVLKPELLVKGTYEYQVCSDVSGQCIPFDDSFTFTDKQISITGEALPAAKPGATQKPDAPTRQETQDQSKVQQPASPAFGTTNKPVDTAGIQSDSDAAMAKGATTEALKDTATAPEAIPSALSEPAPGDEAEGLWSFMLIAFVFGLGALLTPCVFPMIPMTVSFFTSNSTNRGEGIFKALVYGVSIIAIYTLVGTVVAKLFGADGANFISTHWFPNLLFFAVFIIFAMSFFGLFEITLPSSFLTKVDAQADRGGLLGVFFMSLTLVLVSFSCTGPIVGSILVASAGGETLRPVVGMLGFSLAFALPFTLFAVFPSWLSSLPKSGGWLNSVKVVLGFIELALALKFLSVADQVYHWGILDREVYLALWIVIFTLMGFYLLGKLKFSHDSDIKYLSVPRLFLALATFAFVVYLIPGMFGAPLKALSGYLPPQTTQDFDINQIIRQNGTGTAMVSGTANELCETPKYGDFLHLPHGL